MDASRQRKKKKEKKKKRTYLIILLYESLKKYRKVLSEPGRGPYVLFPNGRISMVDINGNDVPVLTRHISKELDRGIWIILTHVPFLYLSKFIVSHLLGPR